MRSRSNKYALFLWILGASASAAFACLRPNLDERAIQWATAIVEADLKSIEDVVEHPNLPKQASQIYWFAVRASISGPLKENEIFLVKRTFSDDAPESRCPVTLKDKVQGQTFVLLLRPGDEKRYMTIVHMLNRTEMDDAAITDLKARIADVRHAEEAGTEDAIAAQVAALASAQDAVEAEEGEKALLQFGPRAIDALTKKLDEPDLTDAGRTRVKRVIAELTPPPQPSEPRD